ncbi:hypothetical protein FRC12_004242 [Ceratobasidium sp. 428]|nr:hypothetical protein FRC12_004242 [Ceratobasidium sp. 428]
MKRATTSLHRRLVQVTNVEQNRGYSEAVALRRRQWIRPAETTTTVNPTPNNNNNTASVTPGSGSSSLRQVSWDPIPSSRPQNDRPGPGAPRQDRRPGGGQGQRQQSWPELPGFNNAPRDRRPDTRRRNTQTPNNNTNNTNANPGNGRPERDRIYKKDERLRAQTEAHILFQQKTSQRQAGSAPWQGVVPPSRSWAVSIPTPGLEEDTSSATHRGKKRDKTARGSALEFARGDPGLSYEEAEGITFANEAAQRKREQKVKLIEVQDTSKDVYVPSAISVSNLARLLNVRIGRLQDKMYAAGMVQATYDHILTADDASLLALELGFNPVVDEDAAFDVYPEHPHPNPSTLPLRPPVVTIMGHVDHGKTTLLDTLRSASVAAGEAGGITQHIGAFSVPIQTSSGGGPRTVTFLDTPGHAAFSAMRARGAGVTDIVVLVVAADDGVMPQTKEVIELTRRSAARGEGEGGVQLVVAINKCDKPGVDKDKVKHALLAEGVQLEEFGGDVPAVEVSGLTGAGLDTLTETLATLAEMAELRSEVDIRAHGRVLESRVDKGRGPVATVLIQRGSLKTGSALIAGTSWARVRQMADDKGRPVKVARPGDAVTVAGWKDVPSAGDEVLQAENEDSAKRAVVNRKRIHESRALAEDVERINEKRRADKLLEEQERLAETTNADATEVGVIDGAQVESSGPEVKELKLVIKGDVSGSIEAVAGALCGIGNKVAKVKIVSQSVGEVSESDVALAKAVDGMIVGFNVNAPSKVRQVADQQGVPLHIEGVIYKLMDEIKNRVIALLPVTYEQRVLGEATVQEIFTISLKGRATTNIAGCRIVNGVIAKNAKVRVMREGVEVYDGAIDSLKQHKKEMTEMRKGNECGMSFTKFEDLKAGDHIQTYETIEKPGVL